MSLPLAAGLTAALLAAPPDGAVALDDVWPDLAAGKRLAGELTHVDHVNRTGVLRPDRLGTDPKDSWDLPLAFDLPPYGQLRRCGAEASLADVPLGTHLHGVLLPGPGAFVEPAKRPFPQRYRISHHARFRRAVRLEDDFSFYSRLGLAWTIAEVNREEGVLLADLTDADGNPAEPPPGEPTALSGRQRFRIAGDTTVWRGGGIVSLDDLTPGRTVQVNLGWASILGKDAGLCRAIWLDDESRALAANRQTRARRASLKRRGVPAKVEATTHAPGDGAAGTLTVVLYAGFDEEVRAAFAKNRVCKLLAAEPSLRTYEPLNDTKRARITAVTVDPAPPFGSSGVRLEMTCDELLEGFRPGRTVRLEVPGESIWEFPREERLWPRDVRVLRAGIADPTLRRVDLSADPR